MKRLKRIPLSPVNNAETVSERLTKAGRKETQK